MDFIWGLVVIVFSLIAWVGQTINAFAAGTAAKYGLTEAEADVDPAFYADCRGEAKWDVVSLWPLTVAGLLLLLDQPEWAYF